MIITIQYYYYYYYQDNRVRSQVGFLMAHVLLFRNTKTRRYLIIKLR